MCNRLSFGWCITQMRSCTLGPFLCHLVHNSNAQLETLSAQIKCTNETQISLSELQFKWQNKTHPVCNVHIKCAIRVVQQP